MTFKATVRREGSTDRFSTSFWENSMQHRPVAVTVALVLFTSLPPDVGAQTTAGASAAIVVPVIAQTSSFGSEVTVYNPNAASITITPVFYDAQNTASPGPKPCTSLSVGANVTTAFTIASQCALQSGSSFGLLVLTESTGSMATHALRHHKAWASRPKASLSRISTTKFSTRRA